MGRKLQERKGPGETRHGIGGKDLTERDPETHRELILLWRTLQEQRTVSDVWGFGYGGLLGMDTAVE